MLFYVKTGSEWHTTEKRGCMVKVNGSPIYQVLKPVPGSTEWELVGNKGKHGRWCLALYEIPEGSHVTFEATANGKPRIFQRFIVGDEESLKANYDG